MAPPRNVGTQNRPVSEQWISNFNVNIILINLIEKKIKYK